MKKILVSILVIFGIIAAVSAGDQDKKEEAVNTLKGIKLSATEDEVVKFIAAFPEFIKENKELNPADPETVTSAMSIAAENQEKWEKFAKEKGFSSYDNFLKVTTAVSTVYAYQLLQKNSDDLEKKIGSLPAVAQGMAKKQLKPLKEQISKYKELVTPETIAVVDAHSDELKAVFAPVAKLRPRKK
ncbi:MAG TPA: hypothetical protein DET40_08440 [Lentisphaeria bacterium]|nr:MAG: hypothetical protein A2X45_12040 [Lentisphaerae bacterium GWF2_50_93]HCE43562.1 hypothetical protein [Lentisphaeria bacterium]